MSGARREVLALFRRALRVARTFPEPAMGRKLRYNARELLRLRAGERSAFRVQRFLREGDDALRVYELLATDRKLLAAITRKPPPQ